ncbi:MAG: DUF488 domain-containing protein [Ignisphaera sp.]
MVKIYTIGYEGRTIDEFIKILERYGIRVVLDVRHQNMFVNPSFSRKSLTSRLSSHGITYIHLPRLGVPKILREPYINGRISHECFKMYYTYYLEQGLEDLLKIIDRYRSIGGIVLMCSERFPKPFGNQKHYCHRFFVSEKLIELKIFEEVEHIL